MTTQQLMCYVLSGLLIFPIRVSGIETLGTPEASDSISVPVEEVDPDHLTRQKAGLQELSSVMTGLKGTLDRTAFDMDELLNSLD